MQNDRQLFTAALLLAGKPLDIQFLKKILHAEDLESRLASYVADFNSLNSGIYIRFVSNGYQMTTDPLLSSTLEKYFGERTEVLSRGAMETLSVVAYKQPATKAEVEMIRGVDCSGTMRGLLEKGFITVSGRKNVPGKPLVYATTKYFLEYFGLKDLSELPTFREWQELRG